MADSYTLGPVPAPKGTAVANLAELKSHPELYFEGADILIMLMSSALVFLMIPGMALVYSGAADRHSAITMARVPLITAAFVGIQWYLWGYTLAFSPSTSSNSDGTISWLGGDTKTSAFRDFSVRPVGIQGSDTGPSTGPKIPELVYALYQGMFASFTASIVAGSVMRKVSVGRFLVFISIWSVVVYDPIARWTWHPQGWSRLRGVMDFAGGTAVHVCSGAAVAAYSVFFQLEVRGWRWRNLWDSRWRQTAREGSIEMAPLASSSSPTQAVSGNGRAHGPPQPVNGNSHTHGPAQAASGNGAVPQSGQNIDGNSHAPNHAMNPKLDLEMQHLEDAENHNVSNVVLGTTLLWFGWFGFNGGSAQGANLRAVSAVLATHVAACAGGSVGLLLEWLLDIPSKLYQETSKVPTVLGFCDGAISGLVAITPAAGFVPVKVASVFGVVAAIVTKILRFYIRKRFLPYDILDICAVHAGGGFIGMFLTALFADEEVIGYDGYSQLIRRTIPQRLRTQLLDVTAGFFYSFTATFVLLVLLKLVSMVLRRPRRWARKRIHKHLLATDDDYAARHPELAASARRNGPPVVKDKLVALPQHSWLER